MNIIKKQYIKKAQRNDKLEGKTFNLLTRRRTINSKHYSKILLISFAYSLYLETVQIMYALGFYDFDLWPFNILF